MDSEILDQLTNLEKYMDSEVSKSRRGRKKKTDSKVNEVENNDLGKEYTEQQVNEMDSNNISILSNSCESVLRRFPYMLRSRETNFNPSKRT